MIVMDGFTSRLKRIWEGLAGVFGLIAGIIPHVLHHIGLVAGAAFLTGAAGSVIFGIVGFVATVPLLIKLYRRFETAWAPITALVIFIAMFLLSSLVIGPWIRGDNKTSETKTNQSQDAHSQHHQ